MNTDLIIIGAGPGGYRAAEYAAKQGLQVVIIEQDEVGGTCLNRGCIPTKTYVHAASFDEARERMGQVVPLLRSGVEGILAHPNITLMRGTASFLDSQTVNVCRDSVVAKNIIIATGSSAKLLPLPDINDPRLVTSTELLQCPTLPKRLAIIGAGVIGMEFASVFHRFGSEVTVIEYLKECLPMVDSDIAKRLRKLLEKRGIKFQMKTAVQSLADIDADMILMATGRKANTEGLNLSAAGITPAPNGTIPTNDNFSCVGCDSVAATLYAIMPAAIFTEPEAACVGPSEDQLKADAVDYICKKSFWRANGKAQAMNETEGMLKLFADQQERIIGCHAYGAHAADIVQEVSVLMCKDTTLSELRDMIHIHPTLSEILKAAVE